MEATFCTLYVTTAECLCHWLLYIPNILGPENGSHILYTIYYCSRIYKACISIVEIWLANIMIPVIGTFALKEPLELIYSGTVLSQRAPCSIDTF